MIVYFEELAPHKRAGGVETVCSELAKRMEAVGVTVMRSADRPWQANDPTPDCVHVQGLWSPAVAKRFYRWTRNGIPCIVSPHGMLERWALAHKFWRKKAAWHLYQKSLLGRAAVLHATSLSEAEQFRKLGLKNTIATIPWGVQTRLTALPSGSARHEHAAEDSVRTALFVGRIYPVKGLPMLIEAWHKVRPAGWKLRIVGPDEAGHRAKVEALVLALGIEKQIEFAGELRGSQLEAAYRQADLFVLPSYSENFGMTVAEALAAGLPVITTQGTPWQRIVDVNCGWWVAATVDGIAGALKSATSSSRSELEAMGLRGNALVRDEFQWDTAVHRFRELYQSVAARGSMRQPAVK